MAKERNGNNFNKKCRIKKGVIIVETSKINQVQPRYPSDRGFYVEKALKYTLDEGQKFISSPKDSYDVDILHVGDNNLKENSPQQRAEKIAKMCNDIKPL